MPEESKKDRISFINAIFLVAFGIFCDTCSILVPGLGTLGWVPMTIWLWLLHVSPLSGKKLATMGVSAIIEIVPAISAFPSVTIGVMIIILMVKLEDKLGIKLPLPK